MKRILINTIALSACALALNSCVKKEELDPNRIAKTSWNPELGLPLVRATLGSQELFGNSDSTAVGKDPNNGLVVLSYDSKELTLGANELFSNLESQTFNAPTVPLAPGITVPLKVPFANAGGSILKSITFDDGEMVVSLGASGSGIANWKFTSITDQSGAVVQLQIPLNASGKIDLNKHKLSVDSQGNFSVEITLPSNASGNANPVFEILNPSFSEVEADLGSNPIPLPQDSIKLHLFKNLSAEGFLKLDNPTIALSYENDFGLPLELDFSSMAGFNTINSKRNPVFTGSNTGKEVVQATSNGKIQFDKTNSDLSEVIQPTPTYLSLAPVITPNPSGSTINTLKKDDQLKLKTTLQLPMVGSLKDLIIRDTVPFGLNQSFDFIKEMGLRTSIRNGYPLNIKLDLKLVDENYVPVLTADGKEVFLINNQSIFTSVEAPVFPNKIDQNSVPFVQEEYNVDEETLKVLLNGKFIIIEAFFETEGQGNKIVGIFDDYKIDLKVGAKVVGNIKIR